MICITGIPGTGKSTVCSRLNSDNISCVNLNDVAKEIGCMELDEVDIECMRRNFPYEKSQVVESHYAHTLRCDLVIILETDERLVRQRLTERGYSTEKIEENIEVQRAGLIHYEALELIPSVKIMTISTGRKDIEHTYSEIRDVIVRELNKKK